MRLLFIGDVVGRPGRRAVAALVPTLVATHEVDFVIANGENAAGGFGITPSVVEELFEAGVDVLTTGNHVWKNKDGLPLVDQEERLLRPANYPPGVPGSGSRVYDHPRAGPVGVINVCGRTFVEDIDCPFRAMDRELALLKDTTRVIIVDMHAEATSEKLAMGWYLDGRVSALLGTHTHVQTADERILPQGMAYITDVGMTGPRDSVIGFKAEPILRHFLTHLPVRFEVAGGPVVLCGALVDIDTESGRALAIRRIGETVEATAES